MRIPVEEVGLLDGRLLRLVLFLLILLFLIFLLFLFEKFGFASELINPRSELT